MKGLSSIFAGRPPRPGLLFVAACAAMLTLVMWIFLTQSDDGDLHSYQYDAQEWEQLSMRGMYSCNTMEYPPLALAMMTLTDVAAQQLGDCSGLLGDTYDPEDDEPVFVKFQFLYRFEMALVMLGTFLLLWRMWKAHMAHEAWWERMERFAVFCAGLGLAGNVAFDRLDSMMGALMLVALALMRSRRHYLWSFFALAVAIVFKFVPVILAPLWVLGSLPVAVLAAHRTAAGLRRLFTAIVMRGAQLAGMIVALFLPFLAIGGTGSLAFFTYHGQRGIEFESTYGALLGVLKYAASLDITAPSSFGSHDVASSLSPVLTRLAPVIVLGLLTAAGLLFVASMMREAATAAQSDAPSDAADQRAGRACGEEFTLYVNLLLLIFIFANKVFSPQYLLWLVPLAPLMPLTRGRRMLFHGAFLGVCLLTYCIYPTYEDDTLGAQLWAGAHGGDIYSGPTPFGVMLLAGRAVLLAGMIGGLTLHLVWRVRAGGEIFNHDHEEHEVKISGELEGLA